VQAVPNGIAQALILGESFLDGAPSALILGDNIFYGANLTALLMSAAQRESGATVFGYYVQIRNAMASCSFDAHGRVTDLLEKPVAPPSNYAVNRHLLLRWARIGLRQALTPVPSGRAGNYRFESRVSQDRRAARRTAWARHGVARYRHAQLPARCGCVRAHHRGEAGLKVACVEEIAGAQDHRRRPIVKLAKPLEKSGYGEYLLRISRSNRSHEALGA